MSHPLFERHQKTIQESVNAIRDRTCWSAYPEVPSGRIYGETARDDGLAAFQAQQNGPFELDQPGVVGTVGDEVSPYGPKLGITYPQVDLDVLLPAAGAAMEAWRHADVETRTGVCLEILDRLNKRSFEIGFAVMHTTGQAFMMAFQAGGPHAQDRGLEAVAYAYEAMTRTASSATWVKRVGKEETVTLDKTFRIVPRGVAAVVGCSTFPTWNSYPGLFASLVTGNAVVVKPHPGAILPLALTVETARAVLREAGFDPNLVTLVADAADAPVTKTLLTRPEIAIIDYTGGSDFGRWIEENARHAVVFTEKAGVNTLIIDSIDDLRAVTGNIAFSLSLYSGQMCTASQNIFIPRNGVTVAGEPKSFDDVAGAIVKAVNWLLGEPKRATEILGAIQNEGTMQRVDEARGQGGEVLREAEPVEHATFPEARVCSPLMLKVDAADEALFMQEAFGPIVYIVAVDSTDQAVALAARAAREHGAITCSMYSTDGERLEAAADAMAMAGVPLSCNLTGSIWVNQSAAFSDFHVSGANPAGNATLCDAAFVANRFRVVQSRIPVPQAAPVEA